MGKNKDNTNLIETNNQLRKELTAENETYYSDLLIYLRTAGIFHNEEKVEILLLEILQDILTAQADGMTAKNYFGHEPKMIADQLISTFPKPSFQDRAKMLGLILGISTLISLITQIASPSNQVNPVPFLLNAGLTVVFVQLFFWGLHRSIYTKLPKNKVLNFLLLWGAGLVVLGSFVGVQFIRPAALNIAIHPNLMNGVIILFLLGLTVVTVFGNKDWRNLLIALLPMAWLNGGARFLQNINQQQVFLAEETVNYLLVGASILGLVWFYLMLFRESRQSAS